MHSIHALLIFQPYSITYVYSYTCSPVTYKALQSFEILKWPSKATKQTYTEVLIHALRASNTCIVDQVAQHVLFKNECWKNRQQELKGEAALIHIWWGQGGLSVNVKLLKLPADGLAITCFSNIRSLLSNRTYSIKLIVLQKVVIWSLKFCYTLVELKVYKLEYFC